MVSKTSLALTGCIADIDRELRSTCEGGPAVDRKCEQALYSVPEISSFSSSRFDRYECARLLGPLCFSTREGAFVEMAVRPIVAIEIDLPPRSRNYSGMHSRIRSRRPNSVYADTTNATEWM